MDYRYWSASSPTAANPSPEYDADSRPAAEANLEGRHPRRCPSGLYRSLDSQKKKQVSSRAAVGGGVESRRHPGAAVGRPAALTERIEAEAADEVGARIESMPPDTRSGDDAGSYVKPGREAQPGPRVDRGILRENRINAAFGLESLGRGLSWNGGRGTESGHARQQRRETHHTD